MPDRFETPTQDTLRTTELSRPRRAAKRASLDKALAREILDAIPLAHVGMVVDGAPVVMPTLQWRIGDTVYWHGQSASRTIRQGAGQRVCITVSSLDGFVIARSAMHHSVNYRSVMLFGTARAVTEAGEKTAALKAMVEGLFPDRWDALRPMTEQELKATGVLAMEIDEGTVKTRAAGVMDDEEDYALPIWAGVVPVVKSLGAVQDDPRILPGVERPDHAIPRRLD